MNKEEIELEDSIDQKFLNNLLGTLTVEEAKYVLKKGTGNFCDEVIECAADVLIEEIERPETDKEKLMKKLEERRKQNNNRYGQSIDDDEFPEMYEYSGQVQEDDYILKILKGENHGKYMSNKQQINC